MIYFIMVIKDYWKNHLLGDYLIMGVTTDDFDKNRGKINVQQSLMERIESVRATGHS